MKKKGNNAKYQKPSNLTTRISKRKDIRKEEGMRLNQFIAKAGICSRREADQFISAGLVSVNDKLVVEMGYKVKKSDVVKFNNSIIKGEKKNITSTPRPFEINDQIFKFLFLIFLISMLGSTVFNL